jgi:hypothetical protein
MDKRINFYMKSYRENCREYEAYNQPQKYKSFEDYLSENKTWLSNQFWIREFKKTIR